MRMPLAQMTLSRGPGIRVGGLRGPDVGPWTGGWDTAELARPTCQGIALAPWWAKASRVMTGNCGVVSGGYSESPRCRRESHGKQGKPVRA
jgi:hypothetical protein